ncbi:MAG: solute-binding protein [bacterium]|nr:solute-binding protein [bacterium]
MALLVSLMLAAAGCKKPAKQETVSCKKTFGTGAAVLRVATGSPGELGMLEALANVFNKENKTSLCWVKAGSGKSLKLLKGKKVDAVMVHAPKGEKQAVKDGWAIERTLLGSNEFYIVGPKDDPAGIKSAKSAAEAYKKIADKKANFLSRGDNSGTNKKELAIWKTAGVSPSGEWYIITKAFMMATLKKANEVKGYFMTDSSTWVAGKKALDNLAVLYTGDPFLVNTYHALCQPAGAVPEAAAAAKFVKFLASKEAQELIASYGKDLYGEAMYTDAEYAKKYDH